MKYILKILIYVSPLFLIISIMQGWLSNLFLFVVLSIIVSVIFAIQLSTDIERYEN